MHQLCEETLRKLKNIQRRCDLPDYENAELIARKIDWHNFAVKASFPSFYALR
jgi:hypothetical protein